MMLTTRVKLDRISSSTRNAHLSSEVMVGPDIVAGEGYLLAVRILEDNLQHGGGPHWPDGFAPRR
jgi:hypothetical protein